MFHWWHQLFYCIIFLTVSSFFFSFQKRHDQISISCNLSNFFLFSTFFEINSISCSKDWYSDIGILKAIRTCVFFLTQRHQHLDKISSKELLLGHNKKKHFKFKFLKLPRYVHMLNYSIYC